ncbi:MAG: NAD-dependent protein deacetylase [Polyangiales bacterium]
MPPTEDLAALASLLRGRRLAVLTGAGVSTASGIPDYRGPVTRMKARNPIQHRAFVTDPATRARYWARSVRGWPRFRAFAPNAAHASLAELERRGALSGLITQNVDRLHARAGSADVIELHGALHEARCLDCGALEDRDALQARLLALNPDALSWEATLAPDGDVDLPDEALRAFRVAPCARCEGVLKPDVVFFGDNVPKPRVEAAFARLDAAEALLVVGSSLAVFSGYRFVLRAESLGMPVAIVNVGESRGDPHASALLDAPAERALPALLARL